VAPFTLFDFQRRSKTKYSFRSTRPFPRIVRIFNRLLIVGLLIWGTQLLVRWALDRNDRGLTGADTLAINSENNALEDSLRSDSGFSTEDDDTSDQGDTSPIELPEDSTPATAVASAMASTSNPVADGVHYQKDSLIGKRMDLILRQSRPYAAFYLMVDLATNEILAWGQRSDSSVQADPTFLSRATFPSASVIKIVTSVAALESSRYCASTTIPLIGRSTTLYARQLRVPDNYKGGFITFEDAFAHSCNPAMGLIGTHLGGNTLKKIGMRLGFNRPYPNNVPQMSRFVPPDTGFHLAEVASGFTKSNMASPLHISGIIRALVQKETMQIPFSKTIPAAFAPQSPISIGHSDFQANTYSAIRQLMLRTVASGTARKWMSRTLSPGAKTFLDVGGKTGSLDGINPTGRYDWFAGFAQSKAQPTKGVVVVVMQVHQKYRTLPSPAVAGLLINQWAKGSLHLPEPPPRRRSVKSSPRLRKKHI